MEIDYAAALARRLALRAKVTAEMEAKRVRRHAPAGAVSQVVTLHRPVKVATARPVLMAVASKGGGVINQHFGHAKEFLIYEVTATDAKLIGHRKTDLYCGGSDSCGDGESVLERTLRALQGCEVVLCSKIGIEPWHKLEAAGIKPDGEHGMEVIEEAALLVWREMLASGKLAEPAPERKSA